jgi:hypothetical protein
LRFFEFSRDNGKISDRINATLDGKEADFQSSIVEIEGKIHNNIVSILIDSGASLIYVTLPLLDSNKLTKVKHAKYWLVQLETSTKIKVT